MQTHKLSKFDLYIFWFVVIDNLFLPYFWVKCVSYSFPFVLLWRLRADSSQLSYRNPTKIISNLGLFSSVFGAVLYPEYASDEFVIYLNMLTALYTLQLFAYVRDRSDDSLKDKIYNILTLFIIVVFAWSIVFFLNYGTYESLRHLFNNRIGEATVDMLTMTIRYGYYWSDENNIGYMAIAVFLFLSISDRISVFRKYFMALFVVIIVIATMSSGAVAALAVSYIVFFFYQIFSKSSEGKFAKISAILLTLIVCIIGIDYLLSSDVYNAFSTRVEGKYDGNDTRSEIYKSYLLNTEWWQFMFFGQGGRTMLNGHFKSTHNGILHLILSYGMIVAYQYCKVYFFKAKRQLLKYWSWRIPVFIGFMVNIMITEDKIHGIMMLMLCFEETSNSYLKNKYA